VANVITFSGTGADVRRGRDEEYELRAESGEENRGGSRARVDDLQWSFLTARWTTRIHVRSTNGVGSPRDESGEFARVKLLYDIYHMQIMERRFDPDD